MPNFDIIKKNEIEKSFRVAAIMGQYDIKPENSNERFTGSIDIENKDWKIGLIVGASGTGKTTIAKQLFNENIVKGFEWSNKSILDDMPEDCEIKEITKTLTAVGFSSPPSWLKPFHVLSNGEKMRVEIARALLEDSETVAFDEFTSVVDRDVAKTASLAIQKAIRKQKEKKFIAIACHSDIIDWLMPDWIFDTNTMRFFFALEHTKSQSLSSQFLKFQNISSLQHGRFLKNITI